MKFKKLLPIILSFTCITHGTSSLSQQIKTIGDKAGSQFEQLKKNLALKKEPSKQKLDQEVLADIIRFLSQDSNYKEKTDLQRGFLNRLQLTIDISDTQKENILNMIKQRELRNKQNKIVDIMG